MESFTFDPRLLESLFSELAPPPEPAPQVVVEADAYTMAADYLSMGLYDRAMAEASRAIARGADAAEGYALLGDILCRQGAYGDALEKYRAARAANPEASARAARRGADAAPARARPGGARRRRSRCSPPRRRTSDALMLAATCRFEAGDPAGGARRAR